MLGECIKRHKVNGETLTEVRERYCIPVEGVSQESYTFEEFVRAPLKAPKPPPLPECRVMFFPAVFYTGVDYAGPLLICSPQLS